MAQGTRPARPDYRRRSTRPVGAAVSTPGVRVPVPPLDDAERRRALLAAAEARRVRAEWKSRLASGDADLAELFDAAASEQALAGMRITDALGSLPGIGPRGVERILELCGIAPTRRLRGLGVRQRTALLDGTWGRGTAR